MMSTRRAFLAQTGCGFGMLAASALGTKSTHGAAHHAPRAKRVIFLFMQGGVSQVDSFDYKPDLARLDGTKMPFDDARVRANTGMGESSHRVMKSPWKFTQFGQSGRWVSDLFPQTARHIDDLCLVHGMHTEGVAHGPATLFLHCGSTNFVRPSMGSWVLYGLGSENENVPGFVSIAPPAGNGGARNFGSAFLPAKYQGTPIGQAGGLASDLTVRHMNPSASRDPQSREHFQNLRRLHQLQQSSLAGDDRFEAVVNSYETAWAMQAQAPELFDIAGETASTFDLYGIGQAPTDLFGRQCLVARRLCEAGVRYIQVNYGDNTANPAWDQHSNLTKHEQHARSVDRPIAGLLTDLKQRGLLDDTIVWWGSEFGRTPYAQQNGTGRDHNPDGFTVWIAGGGFQQGLSFGQTDPLGHRAIDGKVHMHDLHATILHQLGLDHERLTYRYAGRDFRLTDVFGQVVRPIIEL